MSLPKILNEAVNLNTTIYIAIGPIYTALAITGFIVCLYAAVSKRVCTKDRATAAAIHILLAMWMLILWRDTALVLPPLVLSVVIRFLLLVVSGVLVFSARLNYPKHITRRWRKNNAKPRS